MTVALLCIYVRNAFCKGALASGVVLAQPVNTQSFILRLVASTITQQRPGETTLLPGTSDAEGVSIPEKLLRRSEEKYDGHITLLGISCL